MIRTIITILFLSALTYGQTNLIKVPASECGGSDGAARLVGIAGTRTAGDTITGSYEASRSAFLFSVTTSGRYNLEYDEDGATGGLSYSANTSWSGTYGRWLPGATDSENLYQILTTADTDNDGKIETTGIETGAVTSDKILDGTIASADLADSSVIFGKVKSGAVKSPQIYDESIDTQDIGDSILVARHLSTALTNFIGSGGSVTNNPDGETIINSGGLALAVNTAWVDTTLRIVSNMRNRLRIFNVREYGAVGDGTTNDSASILNAVNAIPDSGGILYFPYTEGGYNFGRLEIALENNWIVRGDKGLTKLVTTDPEHSFFRVQADTNIVIENLWMQHAGSNSIGFHDACIRGDSMYNAVFQNLTLADPPNWGLSVDYGKRVFISNVLAYGSTGEHGLSAAYTEDVVVTNCVSKDNIKRGLEILGGVNFSVSNSQFTGNGSGVALIDGIAGTDTSFNVSITACNMDSNGIGIDIRNEVHGLSIVGCNIRGSTTDGIQATGGTGKTRIITIDGGSIHGSGGWGIKFNNETTPDTNNTVGINNVNIYDNTSGGINFAGTSAWQYVSISGNRIYENGSSGMVVGGVGFNIIGNQIWNNRHATNTTAGIYADDLKHSVIALNNINGGGYAKTEGIWLTSGSDSNIVALNLLRGHDTPVYPDLNNDGNWNQMVFNQGTAPLSATQRAAVSRVRNWADFEGLVSTDSLDIPTQSVSGTPNAGRIRYNTSTDSLEIWNGSGWRRIATEAP